MGPSWKIRTNSLAKFHQSQPDARLDGSERRRGLLRDLLVREAVEIRELERAALVVRAAPRSPSDRGPPTAGSAESASRSCGARRVRHRLDGPEPRPSRRTAGAEPVDRAAPRRYEKPCEHAPADGVERRRPTARPRGRPPGGPPPPRRVAQDPLGEPQQAGARGGRRGRRARRRPALDAGDQSAVGVGGLEVMCGSGTARTLDHHGVPRNPTRRVPSVQRSGPGRRVHFRPDARIQGGDI